MVMVFIYEVFKVCEVMKYMLVLLVKGVVLSIESYQVCMEFMFIWLNDVKLVMIEEVMVNVCEVVEKFVQDFNSMLGKIKCVN